MKKKIKLKLLGFDEIRANALILQPLEPLKAKYEFIIDENAPDYTISYNYSFEHLHPKYDSCVKIYYAQENIRTDFIVFDYGLGNYITQEQDRFCRYVDFLSPYLINRDISKTREQNLSKYKNRKRFCAFIHKFGGRGFEVRDHFFEKLCSYKKVDAPGKWKFNMQNDPLYESFSKHYADSYGKIEFLTNYKFYLCFENSSYPGHITEKLFNTFEAGCIPIYWGDTSLRCGLGLKQVNKFKEINQRIPDIPEHLIDFKFNPKAYINAHNFATWDELIEEIKRIDNDKNAYEAMLNEPIFLDNFSLENYIDKKEKEFIDFFDHIFSQPKELAFRRGIGTHTQKQQENYQKAFGILDIVDNNRRGAKILTLGPKIRKFIKEYQKIKHIGF